MNSSLFGNVGRAALLAGLLLSCNAALAYINFADPTPTSLTVGDALFAKTTSNGAGTGTFDPFLRLQDSPFEQAFNTSAPGNPPDGFDAKSDPHTHDLLLSSLQAVNIAGTPYFQFILDLAESGTTDSAE